MRGLVAATTTMPWTAAAHLPRSKWNQSKHGQLKAPGKGQMLIVYLDDLADFRDEHTPQHGAVLHLKAGQLDRHILKVGHVQGP